MAGQLSGMVVVMTGAVQGMGRATARRFAVEGAQAMLAEIDDLEQAGLL